MGIYDRDYMRRSPDEERSGGHRSAEDRLGAFLERQLRKHKRLLRVMGLVVAGLILFAFIRVKFGS